MTRANIWPQLVQQDPSKSRSGSKDFGEECFGKNFKEEKEIAKVLWSYNKMWLPLLSQATSSAFSSGKSKDSAAAAAAAGTQFPLQGN